MSASNQSQRAMALLVVLAALVVASAATVLLASAAAHIRLQHRLDRQTMIAQALLRAAEEPIRHWLTECSADVVLPPDNVDPAVTVLHDGLVVQGQECELQITAFDQCGMTPASAARGGSPLRLALSESIVHILDGFDMTPDQVIDGLDVFRIAAIAQESSVFPPAQASDLVRFGTGQLARQIDSEPDSAPRPFSLGGTVATHNHDPVGININTAPLRLVEAALRATGRGGLESIVSARENGKLAPAPALNISAARARGPDHQIEIVGSSAVWAFRIDVHAGAIRQSWWAIYENAPSPQAPQLSWECVQRLAIPE